MQCEPGSAKAQILPMTQHVLSDAGSGTYLSHMHQLFLHFITHKLYPDPLSSLWWTFSKRLCQTSFVCLCFFFFQLVSPLLSAEESE